MLDDVAGGRGKGEEAIINLPKPFVPTFEGSVLDLLNQGFSDMYYYL